MNTLRLLPLAFALFSAASAVVAADFVVDNDNGAPGYTETGSWLTTSNIGAGYNGGSYRFTRSSLPPSTATWTPTIPATAHYAVYAIFRRSGDRSSAVPYTINYDGGSANVIVDQTGSFSGDLGEEFLGVYPFAAGTSGNVVMANVTGGATLAFIADTIRFVTDPGPAISQTRFSPLYPQADQPLTALAQISDVSGVASAEVHWSAAPSGAMGTETAFDDGAHGDGAAGDGLFGATLAGFPDGEVVTFHFEATDTNGTASTGASVQATIGVEGVFSVVVNEVVASNDGIALDQDFGGTGDFVELYNVGPDTADLTGYSLSDDADDPEKWLFPAGTAIPAGGYLLVFCDDANLAGQDLHTSFGLSASGEDVVLYDTVAETVIDQTTFPSLPTDESWSRIPNATGAFEHTVVATPLAANIAGARGAAPQFSHPSGLYLSGISVTISAPGASSIRYTTDGSEPSPTSTLYSAPLNIAATTGLRAKAWYPSVAESTIATASYLFDSVANRTIPVMNLVIDPKHLNDPTTGLFTNPNSRGENWERPGHAVFMNPDGSEMHESGVGVRINGGSSRGLAKKSLRIYLRGAYGNASWSLPWLEKTTAPSFDQLVLRGNSNDGILNASSTYLPQVTFFRDQLLRDLHGETGAVSVDGFFFALYINGQYWGLYNAAERVKADYLQAKLGGSNWDVMKGTWNSTVKYNTEVLDGTATEWDAFRAWLDANDVATQEDFDELKARIDYPGFLKYFALNICAQNEDWPQNNWIATKRVGQTGAKWFFHQNDGEWGLGLRPTGYQSDTIQWAMGNNFMLSPSHNGTIAPLSKLFNGNNVDPNRPFDVNGILDNAQGRKDFISAVEEILNFELEPAHAIAAVDAYEDLIATEVPRESARWAANMIQPAATFNAGWPVAVNNMRTFLNNRPAHIRGLIQTKLGVAGTRVVTFQKAGTGNGRMQIYGRTVDLPWTGTFFDGSTLDLVALPDNGSGFQGWSGAIADSDVEVEYDVTTGGALAATLTFGPAPTGPEANDVIFNEYWVNDDATVYPTVSGPIEGDWVELLVVRNGTDLRGWRVTNNATKLEQSVVDDGNGSLVFPAISALASVPSGTIVLLVSSDNVTNDATFPADDLDPSDRRLIFYVGNGNLDTTTDAGFSITNSDTALTLLAPGASASFADDIGIDFIAENAVVTPTSFFGSPAPVDFPTPFAGIGNNDGAFFTNDALGGFDNDDGTDPNNSDAVAGPGGWVVDPPASATGDDVGTNVLTPGAPNTGQDLTALTAASEEGWALY